MRGNQMRDELELSETNRNDTGDQLENWAIPAILIADDSGRIISVNQSARIRYEKPGKTLPGMRLNEVVITPAIIDIHRQNKKLIREGHSWSGQFLVEEANSERVWTNISVVEMLSGHHKFICLICLPQDMFEFEQVGIINRILAEIGSLLNHVTNYDEILPKLAQCFIPKLADWCFIHLVQPDGEMQQVAIAPENIVRDQQVYNWLYNDLPNDEVDGLPVVLENRKTVFVRQVNPVRRAADAGVKSYMILPFNSGQKTMGMITFVGIEKGHHLDENSVILAENLVMHISTWLEKTELKYEHEHVRQLQPQVQGKNTNELQEALSQLRQSEEVIQTLFRVSNKLNATLDVDYILDTLAQEAIQMVNGDSGFAGLRTADGMVVHKYYKNRQEIPFEHTWNLGVGIPGWVLKYKVPYGTSDASEDPMLQRELSINDDVRSIICTPVLDPVGEVIAYFDIRNKKGAEGFSINDQELLLTLAPLASIAIQNAMAYQERALTVAKLEENTRQLKKLAASLEETREEERLQIARELHDELGQALTAIKFDLVWMTDQLGYKNETLSQKTIDISSQVNNLIRNIRRMATHLRPGMLDDLGLVASIEWQARDFEKRTGIKCDLSLSDLDEDLGGKKALAIFRIFQEELTNIVCYAEAKHVNVNMKKMDELLILEIHDDGRGIKEEDIMDLQSLGLIGMRERAEQLGGTFDIQGHPGEGTTLKVTIPYKTSQTSNDMEGKDAKNPNRR
jgi:signal transduction histidine kinase